MRTETRSTQKPGWWKRPLGILFIVIGLLALFSPLTPGSWLVIIGAEFLGIRLAFWERLRRWWRGRYAGILTHKQAITAMETEVGKVVHHYDRLGVAIIELSGKIAVGDRIKVKRGDQEFEQDIASMQVEHEAVTSGKKGDAVGIKVDQKTKEGAVVYKVTA